MTARPKTKPNYSSYVDENSDTDLSHSDAKLCEIGTVAEKETDANICKKQITEEKSKDEGSISKLKATSETSFNRNIVETKELLQFRSHNIVYFITSNGCPCDEGSKALLEANKIPMKCTVQVGSINALKKNNNKYVFIAPPLKIRFSVPVERVETTIFNPRVESRCFSRLHSYSQSDSQKSCYEK